jgi:hypothetical protein
MINELLSMEVIREDIFDNCKYQLLKDVSLYHMVKYIDDVFSQHFIFTDNLEMSESIYDKIIPKIIKEDIFTEYKYVLVRSEEEYNIYKYDIDGKNMGSSGPYKNLIDCESIYNNEIERSH